MVATYIPNDRHRQGFTLIELLVVVGIIAVLASILFPVFTKARARAWQTSCVSNQKQIVTGMLMLLQDAKGKFPDATTAWGDLGLTGKVLHCPAAPKAVANAYALNENLCGTTLSGYPSPEKVVVVADGATRTNFARHDTDLAYRHNRALVVGCADGHVEATKPLACVELYPLGHQVADEAEIEQKFGFTIRPARESEAYPQGMKGRAPTPDEYQSFFDLNLKYFSLWPDTAVNRHGHTTPAIKEIIVSAELKIGAGVENMADGIWYADIGTCADIPFYTAAFPAIITDKEWTALNDPPTTPYGFIGFDPSTVDTMPNFLSPSDRISPSAERWFFWHALITRNAWVRYRAEHDAAINAKMVMLQARVQDNLHVPWPYFDTAFWTYMRKPQQTPASGGGEQITHYEALEL